MDEEAERPRGGGEGRGAGGEGGRAGGAGSVGRRQRRKVLQPLRRVRLRPRVVRAPEPGEVAEQGRKLGRRGPRRVGEGARAAGGGEGGEGEGQG